MLVAPPKRVGIVKIMVISGRMMRQDNDRTRQWHRGLAPSGASGYLSIQVIVA